MSTLLLFQIRGITGICYIFYLTFVVRLILSHRATDVVIECFDLKDQSAKTVAATNPDNEAWRDLFTRCELILFFPNAIF